jgi:hypothetical protein
MSVILRTLSVAKGTKDLAAASHSYPGKILPLRYAQGQDDAMSDSAMQS